MQIVYPSANGRSSRAHPAGLQPVNTRRRQYAPPAAAQPFAGEAGAFLSARRLGEGPPPAGRGLRDGIAERCVPVSVVGTVQGMSPSLERWYRPGSLHLGLELGPLPGRGVLPQPSARRQLDKAGPLRQSSSCPASQPDVGADRLSPPSLRTAPPRELTTLQAHVVLAVTQEWPGWPGTNALGRHVGPCLSPAPVDLQRYVGPPGCEEGALFLSDLLGDCLCRDLSDQLWRESSAERWALEGLAPML